MGGWTNRHFQNHLTPALPGLKSHKNMPLPRQLPQRQNRERRLPQYLRTSTQLCRIHRRAGRLTAVIWILPSSRFFPAGTHNRNRHGRHYHHRDRRRQPPDCRKPTGKIQSYHQVLHLMSVFQHIPNSAHQRGRQILSHDLHHGGRQ